MKISVIIPVYNGEKWIDRCLTSLLDQELAYEMEIVIIDDGSTDESLLKAKEYAKNNSTIKVISTANKGVSNARNIGLKESKGEYVTFVDIDDYVEPGFFKDMLSEVEKKTDVICCGFKAEYSNGYLLTTKYNNTQIEGRKELIEAFLEGANINVNVWGKLYRSEIAKSVKFDTSYKLAEDKLYLFECLNKAKTLSTIESSKYHYVINENSVMREAFSPKKLDGLFVSEKICAVVESKYPELSEMATSWFIDTKCRICEELLTVRKTEQYKELYRKLLKEIRKYSIIKKFRHSTKKHFVLYITTCISPIFCNFIKKRLKFQYKS